MDMETRMLNIVDELKQENEYLHTEMMKLRDALGRSTEELSVLRHEMKQIIEGLDELTSSTVIESIAEQLGVDFEGAYDVTYEDRDRKINELKWKLWDMMKIVMENREALGLDCPVM